MSPVNNSVAVAFSGGLDTSWLVARMAEAGHPVTAISVNTGAWEDKNLAALAAHAERLGATEHVVVDGRDSLYDDHIAWLIRGNVLRGQVYPLCVGVERVVQARLFAQAAAERDIGTLVHGSTGAGNDQVRFELCYLGMDPNLKCVTLWREPEYLAKFEGRQDLLEFGALRKAGQLPLFAFGGPHSQVAVDIGGGQISALTTEEQFLNSCLKSVGGVG